MPFFARPERDRDERDRAVQNIAQRIDLGDGVFDLTEVSQAASTTPTAPPPPPSPRANAHGSLRHRTATTLASAYGRSKIILDGFHGNGVSTYRRVMSRW